MFTRTISIAALILGAVLVLRATAQEEATGTPQRRTVGEPTLAPPPPQRIYSSGEAEAAPTPPGATVTADSSPTRPAPTGSEAAPAPAAGSAPAPRPLHERLIGTRRSVFGGTGTKSPNTSQPATDPPAMGRAGSLQAPSTGQRRDAGEARRPDPAPTPARRVTPSPPPGEPVVASPPPSTPVAQSERPRAVAEPPPRAAVPRAVAETRPESARPEPARPEQSSNVLIAPRGPMLSVETLGPRRITVGREAAYEVTVLNSGEMPADEVAVLVNVPPWTEIASAEASIGSTRAAPPGGPPEPFRWNVGRLAAKGREKLVLRIVPRQSRAFDLAVRWDYRPAASQAAIEVQEPRLAMRLEGPREVLFGKKDTYRLKVSNAGNGPAENVTLALAPLGNGDNQPLLHRLGNLNAGEEKSLEMELTARQPGDLMIQVEARADGGVRAALAERVLVRRAALQIAVEGPGVQYVGAVCSYRVRVLNPGTAPAQNVKISVNIPPGAKYLSASDGGRLAAGDAKVQWTLEKLDPGSERIITYKCNLTLPGPSRTEATSMADDELVASAEAITRVDAMADLRLEVKDPQGPVPVGEETTYELRVRNRGTKAAQDVEVVAYFSNGIEPTGADGGPYRLGPGQVAFTTIPTVGAGAELNLKVRAKAEAPGNHVFRAEVRCRPLGTRLVSEETTHYYQDAGAPQMARTPPGGPVTALPPQPPRTADGRLPPPPPQNGPGVLYGPPGPPAGPPAGPPLLGREPNTSPSMR